MFDGFDDDYVAAPRRPRPIHVDSLAALQAAVLAHDATATAAILRSTTASVEADGAPSSIWAQLSLEVGRASLV